jgi:(2Fe-2S) ferredoxin
VAGKIKSWNELKDLKEKVRKEALGSEDEFIVMVGTATCGSAAGGDKVLEVITEGVKKAGLTNVRVLQTGCYGNCYAEPVVEVRRGNQGMGEGVRYGFVDAARAKEIVDKHLSMGKILEEAVVGKDQEVYIP